MVRKPSLCTKYLLSQKDPTRYLSKLSYLIGSGLRLCVVYKTLMIHYAISKNESLN